MNTNREREKRERERDERARERERDYRFRKSRCFSLTCKDKAVSQTERRKLEGERETE